MPTMVKRDKQDAACLRRGKKNKERNKYSNTKKEEEENRCAE
jgi:hypothetical protein